MDRIERALERLSADHEQFRQDHKQLLIAQVVQSEQIADLLKVTQEHTRQFEQNERQHGKQADKTAALDERVDKLVIAIGRLIDRSPKLS